MGLIKPGHSLPASVLTVGLAGVSADAGAADRASRIREELELLRRYRFWKDKAEVAVTASMR